MLRMSLSYTEEIEKFLMKKVRETGLTKAGVIRRVLEKEIDRNDSKVDARRSN